MQVVWRVLVVCFVWRRLTETTQTQHSFRWWRAQPNIIMSAPSAVFSRPTGGGAGVERSVSAKALKVLGATEEEVRMERALIVSLDSPSTNPSERIFIECAADAAPAPAADGDDEQGKAEKTLGVPAAQNLKWLQHQSGQNLTKRRLPSKALATLGATIDDVRIEKALLVLGEAPGREVPAGRLPRPTPPYAFDTPTWSVPPRGAEAPAGISVFLCAFLPWGILAPLNVLKLQLNKVRPPRPRG